MKTSIESRGKRAKVSDLWTTQDVLAVDATILPEFAPEARPDSEWQDACDLYLAIAMAERRGAGQTTIANLKTTWRCAISAMRHKP